MNAAERLAESNPSLVWESDTERLRHVGSHAATYESASGEWYALRPDGSLGMDVGRVAKFLSPQQALSSVGVVV
jgi:hypothetical protein